jgi:nitroreductase
MDLYQSIFKRKSIRNYDIAKLDSSTIKDIEEYLNCIKPYDSKIKIKSYIFDDEKQISGFFKIKAPHYIAITSEKKEDYLINVGYILEQLVMYLTTKEIGTCWLGGSKPNPEILKGNSLDYVVMLAFGKAKEPLYRENVSEFKRKSISEISNLNETNNVIEAVRLAPSASNQQAWYFEYDQDEISVYCKKVMHLMDRMSKIDIGIALAHIYIAAKNEGKNIGFMKKENNIKSGYEYIITCRLV